MIAWIVSFSLWGLSHELPTSKRKPGPCSGKILFKDAQIILSG